MSPASLEAKLICDAHAEVGEGPAWLAQERLLVWVDIMPGLVHQLEESGQVRRTLRLGRPVGAAIPREGGGMVAAVADGLLLLDREGQVERHIAVEADRPGNRMNDAKADPMGRLWAGTMALDSSTGAGSLYRVEVDGRVERVIESATISNGLDWSPDGRTFYWIDSPTLRVEAFDFDTARGALSDRRTVVETGPDAGMPDGMCVDAESCLWVAFWGGGCVRRYSPAGEHLATVELPVSLVTSCCFGGIRLETLYITTAAGIEERLPAPAGGVYRVAPGVSGQPTRWFGG